MVRGYGRRVSRAASASGTWRNVEIRPLGGRLDCLLMVLFSVAGSVILTVLLNLQLR